MQKINHYYPEQERENRHRKQNYFKYLISAPSFSGRLFIFFLRILTNRPFRRKLLA
jgi:hypothetical protein